jgi:hypothetical protein
MSVAATGPNRGGNVEAIAAEAQARTIRAPMTSAKPPRAGRSDVDTTSGDDPGSSPPRIVSDRVDVTRAWTGLLVVIGGDVAIALAAILGIYETSSSGDNVTSMVAILTSAFTAISTMTTSYFGIRAVSNTAQSSLSSNNP